MPAPDGTHAARLHAQLLSGPRARDPGAVVPPPELLARPDALARLARRYLAGHGPADARDLAKWVGLTLGDAHLALDGISDELIEVEALVDLADRKASAARPRPRLLGPFDPLLLGWVSRDPAVGAHKQVVTHNGLFRACALVDGRAVATWGSSGATFAVTLLETVKAAAVDELRRDAADVLRFLGRADRCDIVVTEVPLRRERS